MVTVTDREARLAPATLRTAVDRGVLLPVTAVLGVVTVASACVTLSGGTIPAPVQLVPFAVSILLFGLPHGALDHLVPARVRPGTSIRASVAVVVLVYLVVGGATAGLWLADPLLGFAAFIAITWFHWGQGDLFVDRLLDDGAPGAAGAALTVAARGALPMLVPLAAYPTVYAAVVGQTTALVGAPDRHLAATLSDTAVRVSAAVLVLLLVSAQLVAVHRSGRSVRRAAVETVLLAVFFAAVPPVLAVGLYFTLWHAVRHIVRLELTDPGSAARLAAGDRLRLLLRFLAQAWPITAIAVLGLVALSILLRDAGLGVYLLLIAALTTPHTVVVSWMDRRQRTWREHSHHTTNQKESPCSTVSPRSA